MLRIALSLLFLALAFSAPGEARPNILYVYVDDMGWGAIGPNGQAERKAAGLPHLITPHLDQLAAEGVNFRRSYGLHGLFAGSLLPTIRISSRPYFCRSKRSR